MNNSELARFFLSLVLLLAGALAGGHVFERLKMPRVIGEIVGGIALGPSMLGLISPETHKWLFAGFPAQAALLSAFYWFGLVLLMFTAGFKMQAEGAEGSGRVVAAQVVGGLMIPFALGYAGASLFADTRLGDPLAFKLVMGIAVAVTSIPVISRIFLDLGLMNTPLARNVIGAATIQDLILWTVLAIATAVQHGDAADAAGIGRVIAITLAFVLASLFVAPAAVRVLRRKILREVQRSVSHRIHHAAVPGLRRCREPLEGEHRLCRAFGGARHGAVFLTPSCCRAATHRRHCHLVFRADLLRARRLAARSGAAVRCVADTLLHRREHGRQIAEFHHCRQGRRRHLDPGF